MRRHASGVPNPRFFQEAKSAYWSAVSTLIEAKISRFDDMIHGGLRYLCKLMREAETQDDQAA